MLADDFNVAICGLMEVLGDVDAVTCDLVVNLVANDLIDSQY